MFRQIFLPVLLLLVECAAVIAAPLAPEIEEAYKQGQADWDRGDPVSALPRLKKAADGGHAVAQYLYAYMLDQADNDEEAAAYYQKAAALGNADAMVGLAGFYLSGDGNVKADALQARKLFVQAAEAGQLQAIAVLVIAYGDGGLGLTDAERNPTETLKWFNKGAEVGNIVALTRLVKAHRDGELGLPVNPAEAERLQLKIYALQGIDPKTVKVKRKRR